MFSSWKNREECERLRDSLEMSAAMAALPARLQEHLSFCADCQAAADELLVSRALLRKMPPPLVKPGPWFAPRVMAAIAARESNLLRSQEAWTVVPKLAARLTWISALALLFAGTWLFQSPRSKPKTGHKNALPYSFLSPTHLSPEKY